MKQQPTQRHQQTRPKTGFSATSELEEKFRTVLRNAHGWDIVEMDNDGSCLFRSISHQVYGTPDHHGLVREKCVDYMVKEKKPNTRRQHTQTQIHNARSSGRGRYLRLPLMYIITQHTQNPTIHLMRILKTPVYRHSFANNFEVHNLTHTVRVQLFMFLGVRRVVLSQLCCW